MKRLALLVPAVALASGCGITSGIVTAKEHDELMILPMVQTVCTGNSCMPVITQQVYPECWRLELRNADETGSVCVDRPTWERVTVGQKYAEGSS